MNVGSRIIVSKIVLVVFLSVLGLVAYFSNIETVRLLDNGLSRLQTITEIQDDILETQSRYRRSMRSLTKNSVNDTRLETFFSTTTLREKVRKILNELDGLSYARRVAIEFEDNYSALKVAHDRLISSLSADNAEQLALSFQTWQNAQTNNDLLLSDMVAMAKIRLGQDYATVKRQHLYMQYCILVILGLAICYVFFSARHFFRSVVSPLKYLSSKAKNFAEGNRSDVTEFKFNDEIGLLSRNMKVMQKKVISNEAKLVAANARLERFAAVAAHDLKSPLSTGIGFLDVMMSKGADQSVIHYAARARKTLVRALASVDSLLTLSSESKDIEARSISSDEILREVLEDLNFEITSSNAMISSTATGAIYSNNGLLRELLRNLITNSIKYAKPGKRPMIAISLSDEIFDGAKYSVLAVKDNGVGLGNTSKNELLNPFTRGSSHKNGSVSGVGLGLSICNEIMEAHRGILLLEPSPTGGTVVKALFPVAPMEDSGKECGDESSTLSIADMKGMSGKHVLLVDDDPSVRQIVGYHLRRMGIEVSESENGEEALGLLNAKVPDLIITDLHMPVCDGIGLLAHLKTSGLTLPIIALSADSRESERKKHRQAGFSDSLQKGATPTMLYRSISHCLSTGTRTN